MSAPTAQVVQLNCPQCRTLLRTQLIRLIDVGRQPELKNYLLSGQLNTVVCPNCGTPSMIGTPLIYHDAAKQLFLVMFPQQISAPPEEQERFIGEATSLLMRSLPPDQPKGYLLAPRRFLTLNSLVDAILEADGVSREMVELQRKRVELISQLAEAYEQDEKQLQALVEQHRAELDYEFFATLTAFAEASAQSGRDGSDQFLLQLRDSLAALVGMTLEGEEEAPEIAMDEVLNRLISASEEQLDQTIV